MKCRIYNPTQARRVIHLGTTRDTMLAIDPGQHKEDVDVPDHVVETIRERRLGDRDLIFTEPGELSNVEQARAREKAEREPKESTRAVPPASVPRQSQRGRQQAAR